MAAGKAIGNAIKELLEKFEINIFTTSGIGRALSRFGSEWFTTVVWYGALLSLVALCFKYRRPIWKEISNLHLMQRLWLIAMSGMLIVGLVSHIQNVSGNSRYRYDDLKRFANCPELFGKEIPSDVKSYNSYRDDVNLTSEQISYYMRCASHSAMRRIYAERLGTDFDAASLKKHLSSQHRSFASESAAITVGVVGVAGLTLYLIGMLLGWVVFGRRHIQGKQQ